MFSNAHSNVESCLTIIDIDITRCRHGCRRRHQCDTRSTPRIHWFRVAHSGDCVFKKYDRICCRRESADRTPTAL